MVEQRESRSGKSKLSLLQFERIALLIGGGAGFLAACQEAGVNVPIDGENSNNRPAQSTTEAAPVIEATPTSENAPAAFTENLPALQEMGFSLRQGERGWELVDQNGTVAFSAVDTLTITAYGQNGEVIIVPQQAFGITETAGLGMEKLVTLKNEQGGHAYMYLDAGYTAPVQEQYNNFEDLENCPRVDMNALWSGQLAKSEAINAQPFPEGTIAPDGFGYTLWKGADTYWVLLSDSVGGFADGTSATHFDTYHRRWISCYRSTTPEGVEVIIATEQVLMPDGKTSAFFHYVLGWKEWAEGKDFSYGGTKLNITDSVFSAYTKLPEPGFSSVKMRPMVFIDSYDPNFPRENLGVTVSNDVAAAMELYDLPQNDPAAVFEGVDQMAREREPEINGNGSLDWANQEAIKKSQELGFFWNWPFVFNRDEFFAKKN